MKCMTKAESKESKNKYMKEILKEKLIRKFS